MLEYAVFMRGRRLKPAAVPKGPTAISKKTNKEAT